MSFPGSILLNQGAIYQQTSDKRLPLGTRGYTRDGRVFHYAKAGGSNLSVGLVMCSAVTAADEAIDELLSSDYETPTTSSTLIYLSTGSSLTTAGYYNDGYFFCNDGTGEGQLVQIKSDAGATTAAADIFPTFYPYEEDKFTATFTTSSEFGLVKNIYDKVIVRPQGTLTSAVLGVTPRAVTTLWYFWLQTWGPCPIKTEGTVVIGAPVMCSSSTVAGDTAAAGDVRGKIPDSATDNTALSTYMNVEVGTVLIVGATGESSLVNLHLSP